MDLKKINCMISVKHLYNFMEYQVKQLGFRPTGSENSKKLIRYISDKFKEFGLNVDTEDFPCYMLDKKKCSLILLGPELKKIYCLPFAGNPPFYEYRVKTPDGGLRSEIIFCNEGRPKDYWGKEIQGKTVLFSHNKFDGIAWKIYEAIRQGAKGAIIISKFKNDMLLKPLASLQEEEVHSLELFPHVPVVIVSRINAALHSCDCEDSM